MPGMPGRYISLPGGLLLAALGVFASAQPVQTVDTARSQEEPIVQHVRVTGSVTSPRTANLSGAVAGLVESYAVDAGDRVRAGDALIQLDAEPATLALGRIRAERSQVEAELSDARRRLAEAERLGRQADIAETEVESRRAEVFRLEAALDAARAAVAEQEAVVRRHEINAPFDGVIVRRHVERGEWVDPGATLLELVATDSLWFDFQVPQNFYPRVSEQTEVMLRLEALGEDNPIEGRVHAIVPVKDPSARTFLLRVVAAGDVRYPITPGMSARGTLRIDTQRVAVTVPRDALLRYPDGRTTVWRITSDGERATAEESLVEPGLEFDGRVEIVSGLAPGEQIVTRGNESLQPGQAVRLR